MTAQIGRFIVRDLNPWEAPQLFVLTGNPLITRYMGFATHKTVYDAARLIERYKDSPSKYQAVCPINNPANVLGVIGMEVNRHQATLTLMFHHGWKARGAGRELCKPFVQWIFTHPKIWRVWWYCHVDNVMAQRGLERMGAVREGRLRRFEYFPNVSTEPQDVYVYSIVR